MEIWPFYFLAISHGSGKIDQPIFFSFFMYFKVFSVILEANHSGNFASKITLFLIVVYTNLTFYASLDFPVLGNTCYNMDIRKVFRQYEIPCGVPNFQPFQKLYHNVRIENRCPGFPLAFCIVRFFDAKLGHFSFVHMCCIRYIHKVFCQYEPVCAAPNCRHIWRPFRSLKFRTEKFRISFCIWFSCVLLTLLYNVWKWFSKLFSSFFLETGYQTLPLLAKVVLHSMHNGLFSFFPIGIHVCMLKVCCFVKILSQASHLNLETVQKTIVLHNYFFYEILKIWWIFKLNRIF